MKLTVRYGVQAREAAGREGEVVDLPGPATVARLLTHLAERHGDRLRALLLRPDGTLGAPEHVAGRPLMPAFEVPRDARLVRTINAAYEKVRGTKQPTGAITPPGYYGTDAGHFYKELGMEGIVCGPGGRYNTMPDERVDIADYLDMVRIYLLCILDICEPA